MALLDSAQSANSAYWTLNPSKLAPGFTNAIRRDVYKYTSMQCTTQDIIMQASLKQKPDETTEDDWFDIVPTAAKFVSIHNVVYWVRAKSSKGSFAEDEEVYCMSIDETY